MSRKNKVKYRICRTLITRRVYNWVDFWLEVGDNCKQMGVKPHLRARLARRIVSATVIR